MRGNVQGVVKEGVRLALLRLEQDRGLTELLIVERNVISVEEIVLEMNWHEVCVLAASNHVAHHAHRHSLPVVIALCFYLLGGTPRLRQLTTLLLALLVSLPLAMALFAPLLLLLLLCTVSSRPHHLLYADCWLGVDDGA